MTSRSIYSEYIYLPTTELAAQMPVSARKMTDLSNNLQHLIDESTQYRMQWVRGASDTTAFDHTDYTKFTTAVFPWTWLSEGRVSSINLAIYGQAVSGTLYVLPTFRVGFISPATQQIDLFLPYAVYWSGNTDATTDTQIISSTYNLANSTYMKALTTDPPKYSLIDLSSAGSNIFRAVRQVECRLTVWVKGNGFINYIGVREYCL